jgi:hypothetical protein
VKNLKLLLVVVPVTFLVLSISSCSKSNNNSSSGSGDTVYYSAWISLAPSFVTNGTDSAFVQTLTASHITQSVLDHGTITSWIEFPGENQVFNPTDFGLLPSYGLDSVNLFASYAAGDYTDVLFRYVIIPGTIAVASSANGAQSGTGRTFNSPAAIKSMTYAELVKAYNIPANGASK